MSVQFRSVRSLRTLLKAQTGVYDIGQHRPVNHRAYTKTQSTGLTANTIKYYVTKRAVYTTKCDHPAISKTNNRLEAIKYLTCLPRIVSGHHT